MKKLILGGLAALAIGLIGAPVAGADSNDRAFIKATDKVISGVWPLCWPRRLDRISQGSCSAQDRHRSRSVRPSR